MSSVTSRKLLQKRDFFEGSTTSMADSVDENLPCGQSNKSLLGLVRDTDGRKFRFPSLSQVVARYITVEPLVDGLEA